MCRIRFGDTQSIFGDSEQKLVNFFEYSTSIQLNLILFFLHFNFSPSIHGIYPLNVLAKLRYSIYQSSMPIAYSETIYQVAEQIYNHFHENRNAE